ncbi:glycosyltransferase family 2 protein [Catenulispora acidiphila]|uniref:glycosyltransferase family 2 protein n=1 Tax=Catenulispora acidiphila TaxID=304895 RepID=UPI00117D7B14|nr:glycosyltransferase family A protein [Catenulispora acidiphila]
MGRNRHPAGASPALPAPSVPSALSADPPPANEIVSVLVPLLNDERRVLRCVRALLSQTRVSKLDVVFLDAGSTDLTRRLVLQAAMDDPRVRLLVGAPTPQGWCAHAHACEQLAVAARGKAMVFADPGLALAPGAIASAVAALRGPRRMDLVVAEARRRTPVDRTPATGPRPSTSARLLAVDSETYWRVGGHCNAAHDAHGETGLVRAVRRAGGQVATLDGRHAIEFLDGSLWPRERAGIAAATGSGGRHPLYDTENSILHSFTDTARRLLAAFTTAPTQVRPATSRPAGQVRRAPMRPTAAPAGPVADAAANRAAGYAAKAMAEAVAAVDAGR